MDRIHIRFLHDDALQAPLLLAMAGGHLAGEGLEATWDVAGPGRTIEDGIRSGEVQVAQSALAVSFGPAERGELLPYRHFALLGGRDGSFLVSRDPDGALSREGLEGRVVVADHSSPSLASLRRALDLRRVDERTLTLVDAGDPATMERAFRFGTGAMVHLGGPAAQRLEAEGIARVVGSIGAVIGPVAASTVAAAPDWLETAQAAAFTRALARGRRQALRAPLVEIADLVAGLLPGIPREGLVRAIAEHRRIGAWEGGLEITPELFERTADILRSSGGIARWPAMSGIVRLPPA